MPILAAFLLFATAASMPAPEYFTEYGVLTFTVTGDHVRGTYPHENGVIEGKLDDHELKGMWKQDDGGGEIRITFSADFSTFRVRYNHHETPEKWETDWSGMKRPEVVRRNYRSEWGVLRCDFEGTQLSCSYPWYNGRILGELQGSEFTGLWLQSNGGVGTLRLTFADGFRSFAGKYNDYHRDLDKWAGWKGTLIE